VQQRLIETGLVFVGDQQDLVIRGFEALRKLGLADLPAGHRLGMGLGGNSDRNEFCIFGDGVERGLQVGLKPDLHSA
jgi:hypothetical protein